MFLLHVFKHFSHQGISVISSRNSYPWTTNSATIPESLGYSVIIQVVTVHSLVSFYPFKSISVYQASLFLRGKGAVSLALEAEWGGGLRASLPGSQSEVQFRRENSSTDLGAWMVSESPAFKALHKFKWDKKLRCSVPTKCFGDCLNCFFLKKCYPLLKWWLAYFMVIYII